MAKSPVAGRSKRRLAASIGAIPATRFYRTCLAHTLMRLATDRRWRTLLAVSPDSDIDAAFWPRAIQRVPQGHGDLGVRMQRLFRLLPPGPAIIVGSDIPGIKASDIAKAFRLLGDADAVFGRAPDGGYWLVGLRRAPRLLAPFAGVRPCRHAWQPQGLAHRLCGKAERRRYRGGLPPASWKLGAPHPAAQGGLSPKAWILFQAVP
jgi:glycosyltransferase A (GT-A) superfamily protein (DUF2064 family)